LTSEGDAIQSNVQENDIPHLQQARNAMKRITVLLALIISVAGQFKVFADEPFHSLEGEVVKILRTKYPDATLEPDKYQKSHRAFAKNMREFVVYRLDMMGEWQKPMKVQGPDRGGISVRFYVEKGQWEGQMLVPESGTITNTDDLHVFKETCIVGNSADGKWHIWAMIVTPRVDSPEAVASKLVKLFCKFEKYK
jgi:hypothetical protein